MQGVLEDVAWERRRQDEKWGTRGQDVLADGTGGHDAWWREFGTPARIAKANEQAAAKWGRTNWLLILFEEVCEAFEETDPSRLRAELVQVAAVAVKWIEAIDRRQP